MGTRRRADDDGEYRVALLAPKKQSKCITMLRGMRLSQGVLHLFLRGHLELQLAQAVMMQIRSGNAGNSSRQLV